LDAPRDEVPSESAAAIRVGLDAWTWLTGADRSGRVGGSFRGGVNAIFGSGPSSAFNRQAFPSAPGPSSPTSDGRDSKSCSAFECPILSRSTAGQAPARWPEGHDEHLQVKTCPPRSPYYSG